MQTLVALTSAILVLRVVRMAVIVRLCGGPVPLFTENGTVFSLRVDMANRLTSCPAAATVSISGDVFDSLVE